MPSDHEYLELDLVKGQLWKLSEIIKVKRYMVVGEESFHWCFVYYRIGPRLVAWGQTKKQLKSQKPRTLSLIEGVCGIK